MLFVVFTHLVVMLAISTAFTQVQTQAVYVIKVSTIVG